MNLTINGQSQVPPGFRFHPTEEELLQYYLRKKVAQEKMGLDVIPYVDLNKLEPWDIQEKCKIGTTPQNEWYFFSHKDKKYPTGTRTNRATEAGFWKATGRDKVVYNQVGRIGQRKTLVFYTGRAPYGQKSDWIMYEYRLYDNNTSEGNACNLGEPKTEDGWVICRLFRKKNHCKTQQESPQSSPNSTDLWTQIHNSSNDGDLDQILRCLTKPSKQENETATNININSDENVEFQSSINTTNDLPELESPTIQLVVDSNSSLPFSDIQDYSFEACRFSVDDTKDGLDDWLGLEHLVAFQ